MSVSSHPLHGEHQWPADRVVRLVHFLRHMNYDTEKEQEEHSSRVAVVVTNAIGMVVGLALTGLLSGVGYLAFTVPAQQQQILANQARFQALAEKVQQDEIELRMRVIRLEEKGK